MAADCSQITIEVIRNPSMRSFPETWTPVICIAGFQFDGKNISQKEEALKIASFVAAQFGIAEGEIKEMTSFL